MIDLRSDTVTQPTPEMRYAMANAAVGDDVLGHDPTTEALEAEIAQVLGKEAGIYMPSGTMSNQVAIRLHCGPGDELLCDYGCHIFNYEQGGFAQLSGVVARPLAGDRGLLDRKALRDQIRPDNDHMVRTRLLCLENTHNRAGGRPLRPEETRDVCNWAHGHGLATHLDGARLFNAAVACGVTPAELAEGFDTVSVCFSKGLGAPVGSALVGTQAMIREARRHRKVFGGGMRQCGVIAAAARYALNHHVSRLAEDHDNAKLLAELLSDVEGLTLAHGPVETNLVYFDVDEKLATAAQLAKQLQHHEVAVLAESRQRVRMLTHLDVSRDQITEAVVRFQRVVHDCAAAS